LKKLPINLNKITIPQPSQKVITGKLNKSTKSQFHIDVKIHEDKLVIINHNSIKARQLELLFLLFLLFIFLFLSN